MKIQFIKSGISIGMGYLIGNQADIEEEKAKKLIKDGYCVAMATPKVKRTATSTKKTKTTKK